MTQPIRLARPDVGAAELAAVAEVLESGQLTMGPKVAEFEAGLAAACGVQYAVAVASGTAALVELAARSGFRLDEFRKALWPVRPAPGQGL